MKTWSIVPRDGALFRDARPFVGTAGAHSMPMPWPSTMAGFVRSRIGTGPGGTFDLDPDDARRIAVQGPWLSELGPDGTVTTHLFPAPMDAVFFPAESSAPGLLRRRRIELLVQEENNAWCSDLPSGYRLVGFADEDGADPGKPTTGPAFWTADALASWLASPHRVETLRADTIGVPALAEDERIHVAIDPKKGTADEGKLFTTIQRHFLRKDSGHLRQFGLVCRTLPVTHDDRMTSQGPGTLGGERRLSLVQRLKVAEPILARPSSLRGRILRIVLLTPGLFANGFAPERELQPDARVIAACVPRFHAVSGWCFENRGPKASRRMAPAGSVYWIEFDHEEAALAWADRAHFTCLAATPQDARDGFGLIAVGNA